MSLSIPSANQQTIAKRGLEASEKSMDQLSDRHDLFAKSLAGRSSRLKIPLGIRVEFGGVVLRAAREYFTFGSKALDIRVANPMEISRPKGVRDDSGCGARVTDR